MTSFCIINEKRGASGSSFLNKPASWNNTLKSNIYSHKIVEFQNGFLFCNFGLKSYL